MYAASEYTPYEIDVNKKVRHANETPTSQTEVDFTALEAVPIVPAQDEKNETDTMVTLPSKKEKKSDEAGTLNKFWNWATQLF